jgi:hypothetical protein
LTVVVLDLNRYKELRKYTHNEKNLERRGNNLLLNIKSQLEKNFNNFLSVTR